MYRKLTKYCHLLKQMLPEHIMSQHAIFPQFLQSVKCQILTKLAAMSLMRVWQALDLTSAGSYKTLQLDVGVSVQFWSRCFSSPERLGAVFFQTFPHPHCFTFHSTDVISVDGCLEWGLMAGLRGFASHGGWLDTVEDPTHPR